MSIKVRQRWYRSSGWYFKYGLPRVHNLGAQLSNPSLVGFERPASSSFPSVTSAIQTFTAKRVRKVDLSSFFTASTAMNLTSVGILGAVVFARHADRIESFSSPTTWATYNTFITPLGTVRSGSLSADSSLH